MTNEQEPWTHVSTSIKNNLFHAPEIKDQSKESQSGACWVQCKWRYDAPTTHRLVSMLNGLSLVTILTAPGRWGSQVLILTNSSAALRDLITSLFSQCFPGRGILYKWSTSRLPACDGNVRKGTVCLPYAQLFSVPAGTVPCLSG